MVCFCSLLPQPSVKTGMALNVLRCANLADRWLGSGWAEARLGRRERSDRSRALRVKSRACFAIGKEIEEQPSPFLCFSIHDDIPSSALPGKTQGIDALTKRKRCTNSSNYTGLARESRSISNLIHRFESCAVGSEKLLQTKFT